MKLADFSYGYRFDTAFGDEIVEVTVLFTDSGEFRVYRKQGGKRKDVNRMPRYIDADAAADAISELIKSPYANKPDLFSCGVKDALNTVRSILLDKVPDNMKIPSVNIKEVVHAYLRKMSAEDRNALFEELMKQ